ncbi:MAG: DUF2341 domain-containing protein, partial [Kiritimatiellae bacterium]|nr:DUF2341 domain-containing protein [Kiritimatiellia bacterium]
MKTPSLHSWWGRFVAMTGALLVLCIPARSGATAVDPLAFRKSVTFTVAGYTGVQSLADFPVLVRISTNALDGFSYADCAADGSDLRFADDADNLYPYEIDTWDPDGESLVWVRVPSLANGAKFLMYFGSSDPGATAPGDVWSRYAVVIHGGTGATNAVAGGPVVSIGNTTAVYPDAGAGIVGGGIRKTTGNAKAVNVAMGTTAASTTLENTGKFSVSGWFKRNGNGGANNGTHVLAASRAAWDNGEGFLLLQEQGRYISIAAKGGSGGHQWSSGSHVLADQTWAHVSFAYESGVSLTSWFNGEQDQTKASPGNLVCSGGTWTFGSYANTGSNDSLVGDMDELRVFDGVASGDWMKAEHDAVANASFLAAGEVLSIDPDAPRIVGATAVEAPLRFSVSFSCSMDGATVSYRFAGPGENVETATPTVLTASSTAGETISFVKTGLVAEATYAVLLEAEKDGHAGRKILLTASPFGADAAFTPSPAANDVRTRAGVDDVHVLSSSGTFTLATRRRVRLLAVAGGGGSGWPANTSDGGAG